MDLIEKKQQTDSATEALNTDQQHDAQMNAIVARARKLRPTVRRVPARPMQKVADGTGFMGLGNAPTPPTQQPLPGPKPPSGGTLPPGLSDMFMYPDHGGDPRKMQPPIGPMYGTPQGGPASQRLRGTQAPAGPIASPPSPGPMGLDRQPPMPGMGGPTGAPPEMGAQPSPSPSPAGPAAVAGSPDMAQMPGSQLPSKGPLGKQSPGDDRVAPQQNFLQQLLGMSQQGGQGIADYLGLGSQFGQLPEWAQQGALPVGGGLAAMLAMYLANQFKGGQVTETEHCKQIGNMYGKAAWESAGSVMNQPEAVVEESQQKLACTGLLGL